jgi:surface carbohydrate biosynthesis protein (TIGR04326 family)
MYKIFGVDTSILTIWDTNQTRQKYKNDDESLLLWQHFAASNYPANAVSISDVLEQNADEIRSKILNFIYCVGENVASSSKTKLKFESGFDYFWMTQFQSRPYTQSAQLNNLAKIFTVIEIIKQHKFEQIQICTADKNLSTIIASIAESNSLRFKEIAFNGDVSTTSTKSQFKKLTPKPLLAFISLLQQSRVAAKLKTNKTSPTHTTLSGSISFFDYWYRFGATVNETRKFESQYWTNLVGELKDTDVNWLHNLVDQHKKSELIKVGSLQNDFNLANANNQHLIIDSITESRIVLKSAKSYLKLLIQSLWLKKYKAAFTLSDTPINFWPLFKNEWLNSLRGYEAMINCIRFHRLEFILQRLPKQRLGFYLIENQPWEMALIHLWRKYNHGQLVGVAHSTVRFWDLRLMSDLRRFSDISKNTMPRPDLVAVNGPLAHASLVDAGYPENELVDVEALMYQHLTNTPTNGRKKSINSSNLVTILVATDFLESATRTQMKLLNELLQNTESKNLRVLLKPHWSQTFKDLHPRIEVVSGKEDLATYFDQCDVLYCSAITSAVIDGVCAGVPVIQCLDPQSFNLSPLRGRVEVQVVRTTEELKSAINNLGDQPPIIKSNTLFNLDSQLPKWKALLTAQATQK